jgi:hypothetical protein
MCRLRDGIKKTNFSFPEQLAYFPVQPSLLFPLITTEIPKEGHHHFASEARVHTDTNSVLTDP